MSWPNEVFEAMRTNHPELQNSGFAHVANVMTIQVDSYDFGDGLRIRKALPNEIATLQGLIQLTRPVTPFHLTRNPYETSVVSQEAMPGYVSHSTKELPESEWRYHVIEFDGGNHTLEDFVDASVLTKSRLQLGPTVLSTSGLKAPVCIWGIAHELWDELNRSDESLINLTSIELDELKLVHKKVREFESDGVGLREAIRRFIQLDRIPTHSPLRFLGYVAILESMITHAPDPKDPYDSLTRQVKQKMLLIGRRCRIPIQYEIFGGDVKHEKLWSRLYEYRSAIAHGATVDFTGSLQCLKSPKAALEFIATATVSVMRQLLEEPDLISDLRAC